MAAKKRIAAIVIVVSICTDGQQILHHGLQVPKSVMSDEGFPLRALGSTWSHDSTSKILGWTKALQDIATQIIYFGQKWPKPDQKGETSAHFSERERERQKEGLDDAQHSGWSCHVLPVILPTHQGSSCVQECCETKSPCQPILGTNQASTLDRPIEWRDGLGANLRQKKCQIAYFDAIWGNAWISPNPLVFRCFHNLLKNSRGSGLGYKKKCQTNITMPRQD